MCDRHNCLNKNELVQVGYLKEDPRTTSRWSGKEVERVVQWVIPASQKIAELEEEFNAQLEEEQARLHQTHSNFGQGTTMSVASGLEYIKDEKQMRFKLERDDRYYFLVLLLDARSGSLKILQYVAWCSI